MKNKAFILVVLLIVIAIIGLLVSIIVSNVRRTKEAVKNKTNPSETQTISNKPTKVYKFDIGDKVLVKDFDIVAKVDKIEVVNGKFVYTIIYKNSDGSVLSVDVSEPNLDVLK